MSTRRLPNKLDELAEVLETRQVLLIARSGAGKTVLLKVLLKSMLPSFERNGHCYVPILLDLRYITVEGRSLEDAAVEALRGEGVDISKETRPSLLQVISLPIYFVKSRIKSRACCGVSILKREFL